MEAKIHYQTFYKRPLKFRQNARNSTTLPPTHSQIYIPRSSSRFIYPKLAKFREFICSARSWRSSSSSFVLYTTNSALRYSDRSSQSWMVESQTSRLSNKMEMTYNLKVFKYVSLWHQDHHTRTNLNEDSGCGAEFRTSAAFVCERSSQRKWIEESKRPLLNSGWLGWLECACLEVWCVEGISDSLVAISITLDDDDFLGPHHWGKTKTTIDDDERWWGLMNELRERRREGTRVRDIKEWRKC